MDFSILRPLSPKTGYHFFEGGVGWGWGDGGWGGVKSFRSEGSKQWGGISLSHHRRSNGNAADAKFFVGGSNPGRPTVGGGGAKFARPRFEPPTIRTPGRRITIQPLLVLGQNVSPLLGAASATDKKPKLCVSV